MSSKDAGKKDEPPEGGKVKKKNDGFDESFVFKEIYATLREEERVSAMEKDNDTLKVICKELRLRLDKHLQALSMIIGQLNDEITKKDCRISDLTKLKNDLEEENQQGEMHYGDGLGQRNREHQEHVKELLKQHQDLEQKNYELYEFKKKKSHMERRLRDYRAALEAEQKERVSNVEKLEKRNVFEKDRLKNEMLRKIKETKLSLLAMTEDQLHTTTKRTIMENEQMTTELQYQSKETERIARSNTKLLKENRAMKRQLALHSQQQSMLATRTRFFQKLIKKLTNQLDGLQHKEPKMIGYQLQNGGKAGGHARNLTRRQKATNLALVENEHHIQGLQTRVEDLEEMVRMAQSETESSHTQLQATRAAAEAMFNLQEEAVSLILTCIEDNNNTFRPKWEAEHASDVHTSHVVGSKRAVEPDSARSALGDYGNKRDVYHMPDSLTSMSPDQRETFLRMLLFKLNVNITSAD